jgi:hypothetical protein
VVGVRRERVDRTEVTAALQRSYAIVVQWVGSGCRVRISPPALRSSSLIGRPPSDQGTTSTRLSTTLAPLSTCVGVTLT